MRQRLARRVLLIGWDGADWRMINPLLEAGQMPALAGLIEHGVMGNVASLTPMISPILWTSIATGKWGDKHQVLSFAEPDPASGKLRPVSSYSRKCKAIWNILSENGLRVGVVSWLATHPAENVNGVIVSDYFARPAERPGADWPVPEGSVHPPELAAELAGLRVHPACTTPMQVAPFIPSLAEFDALADRKVQELRLLLSECATTHAVATWLLQTQALDFLAVYYEAIDRFAHAFMEYHPPRAAHVSEQEFERYRHVMTACYRFHDMMLSRLLELAGDDTTVILLSDHGFHCDRLRPEGSAAIGAGRPVAWHRPYGILVIRGPNIKKDQRAYGACLLDITPTVLVMFGLPVARDMDGQPLRQIFDCRDVEIDQIDTYESKPELSHEAQRAATDPWIAQQIMERLAGLGYIEQDQSVEGVMLDRARNLGQIYASTGRPTLAVQEYQNILDRRPDDRGAKIAIAGCYLRLGDLENAERLVREVLTAEADAPLANYFLGIIELRRGRVGEALHRLRAADSANPGWIDLQCQIGMAYLQAQRWKQAERAFKKALSIDPDSAEAHDGLGMAYRAQGRPAEAVYEHMQSIALLHYRPQTHINLGLAAAEVGQFDWAIRAFNVALEQDPQNPFPHECLAHLYRKVKNDLAKAREHEVAADRLRAALSGGKSGAGSQDAGSAAAGSALDRTTGRPT